MGGWKWAGGLARLLLVLFFVFFLRRLPEDCHEVSSEGAEVCLRCEAVSSGAPLSSGLARGPWAARSPPALRGLRHAGAPPPRPKLRGCLKRGRQALRLTIDELNDHESMQELTTDKWADNRYNIEEMEVGEREKLCFGNGLSRRTVFQGSRSSSCRRGCGSRSCSITSSRQLRPRGGPSSCRRSTW